MPTGHDIWNSEQGWKAARQKASDCGWTMLDDATMRRDGCVIYFGGVDYLELSFKHPESRERVVVIYFNISHKTPTFYAIFLKLLEYAPEIIHRYQIENEMIK